MSSALDAFYGTKEYSADIADKEKYLFFVQCFDLVTWKLQIPGVPEVQLASTIQMSGAEGSNVKRFDGNMLLYSQASIGLSLAPLQTSCMRVAWLNFSRTQAQPMPKNALDMKFSAT
jgi:hypothetical protein